MGRNVIDLTGQTFGRLTVIEYAGPNRIGKTTWLCRCDCPGKTEGAILTVRGANLKSGKTKSCGCLRKEYFTNSFANGMTKTGAYKHLRSVTRGRYIELYDERNMSTLEIAELLTGQFREELPPGCHFDPGNVAAIMKELGIPLRSRPFATHMAVVQGKINMSVVRSHWQPTEKVRAASRENVTKARATYLAQSRRRKKRILTPTAQQSIMNAEPVTPSNDPAMPSWLADQLAKSPTITSKDSPRD